MYAGRGLIFGGQPPQNFHGNDGRCEVVDHLAKCVHSRQVRIVSLGSRSAPNARALRSHVDAQKPGI